MIRACILAIAGLVCAPAQAQELTTYTVRAGDSCSDISLRFFGDRSVYDRLHELNPQLGPPPHRLRAGTVLRVPPDVTGGATAIVSHVYRQVEVRGPDRARWSAASIRQPLNRGWQVQTQEDSSAELTFRDRSQLQMRQNTLVIVYGGSGRMVSRRRRASLEQGTLRSRLDELAGEMTVSTPVGEASVGQGDAVVSVGNNGESRLSNLSAEAVTLSDGRRVVRVPAGSGSILRRGRAPTAPRRLPDAPRWAVDEAGRFVGLTGRGGSLRGSWLPVEGATRYRIEVARQPDGSQLEAAVVVPADLDSFVIHRVPAGTYYISVATVDREGLESRPSPRRAMQVFEARVIGPEGGAPEELPYDPGDPSTAFAPPSVLPGTWIVAPSGMPCGVAGAEPREMITLAQIGATTVDCYDAQQRSLPGFEVHVVEMSVRPVQQIVTRRVRTEVEFSVRAVTEEGSIATLRIPQRLVARADRDVDVGRVEMRGDSGRVAITASGSAERVAIVLGLATGDEFVRMGTLVLTVAGSTGTPFGVAGEGDGGPRRPVTQERLPEAQTDVFGRAPFPGSLAISDRSHSGIQPWIAGAVLADAVGSTQGRATIGVLAQVFDQPLHLGFTWSLDVEGSTIPGRTGDADLTAIAGLAFHLGDFRLSFGLDTWVPISPLVNGMSSARLVPHGQISWRVTRFLELATRQGAILSTDGDTRLWGSALALTIRPLAALAFGIELQSAIGTDGPNASALAVGFPVALSLGPISIALGVRRGIGPVANPYGTWSGHLSVGLHL